MFIKQDSQSRERDGGGRNCLFCCIKLNMTKKPTFMLENTHTTFHKDLNFANESPGRLSNINSICPSVLYSQYHF